MSARQAGRPARRPARRPGPSARSVALEAIRRVIDERAYSTLVVPALLGRSGLDARDRAFATELAYGTLRRRIPIDHAIEAQATRPLDRMGPGVRHALRLGAYQLSFTAVPAHAAVSETVSLVAPRERGFVNAILRGLATHPWSPSTGSDVDAISLRTGLAAWAVRELQALIEDEAEAAADAFARRGPLCLRTNTARTDVASLDRALREAGRDPRPAPLDPDCLLIDGGDPTTLPGYREGWFAVQDQASVFVVRALDPRPGERIADVCAAPGGKALAIASLIGPEGTVVAADRSERRVGLIARQAVRLGVRPSLLVQDATAPAIVGPFDRVLVDAPCSGIGSARRRPELLWRVDRERLTSLAVRQVRLFEAAADLLRPGGRLVYSVCTFPRAETDAVCDELLRTRSDLVPIETVGPGGPSERHRLWPHRDGSDGMFVAAFVRSTARAERA
jgi:16S rRNA (cytosine967-C5)-methyltransferase